ncbi:MAG: hypothetical protein RLZZ385_2810 [Pseudomonadota bacterium]
MSGGELLDSTRALNAMSAACAAALRCFDIVHSLDSTNSEAMRRIRAGDCGPSLIVAEHQTAGRGRRGRTWVSPPGANLYMSLVWPIERRPDALGGLSLVTALSVLRALKNSGLSGLEGLQVKWPNDIWLAGRKLAGILLESQHGGTDIIPVVIGIGLNVNMPAPLQLQIGQPVADLAAAHGGPVDRSWLLGSLVSTLHEDLLRFGQHGFRDFKADWQLHDALLGCAVEIIQGEERQQGIHSGVDDCGALLLRTAGGLDRISGGELAYSLRPQGSDGLP